MWVCLVLAVVLFFLIYFKKIKHIKFARQFRTGLKTVPFLGVSYLFIGSDEDRMQAIQMAGRDAIEQNGAICVWMAHRLYLVVADAEIAQLLLKVCLEKDDVMQMCFKMFIGNGSITAPVHIWRPRRKILMPNFNSQSLKQFVQVFAQESQNTVGTIRESKSATPLSIFEYVSTCTLASIFGEKTTDKDREWANLKNIAVIQDIEPPRKKRLLVSLTKRKTTIGVKIKDQVDTNQLLKVMAEGINIIVTRGFLPWLYYDFIFKKTPSFKKLIEIKNFINNISGEILQSKRKSIEDTTDINFNIGIRKEEKERMKPFLDQLIESSGGKLKYTDVELREEFIVLVVAGTDTSAISISFALLMMARYPSIQEKVYAEIKQVFGDSKRSVEAEDLPHLKYLELVIKETLRLYPPVPIVMRQVDKDVILPSNAVVPSGCGVVVNIWAVHRNPQYWGPDVEQFRPERFLQPFRHPAQFMPFSYGPRNCAGYQYAMAAVKTVLATLLREYRALPPNDASEVKPLRLKFKLMLKDVNNFTVQLENR